MPLKSCFQEHVANSSKDGYVYISKHYSATGADLQNKTVGAVDAAPTLHVFVEAGRWEG